MSMGQTKERQSVPAACILNTEAVVLNLWLLW